jgi:hypothetical protein
MTGDSLSRQRPHMLTTLDQIPTSVRSLLTECVLGADAVR